MALTGQREEEIQHAGEPAAGVGSFVCQGCSFPVSFEPAESIPKCPNCGGTDFRRASMFEQPTLKTIAIGRPAAKPKDWLDEVRDSIEEPGKYLAMFADGRTRVIELSDGWSRIGRSRSANIRLDDPTVSRRHAVIVRTPEGDLRADPAEPVAEVDGAGRRPVRGCGGSRCTVGRDRIPPAGADAGILPRR